MTLCFEEEMDTEFSYGLINNMTLIIYVMPSDGRHLAEDFDPKSILCTWDIHYFTDKYLQVNVTFLNASQISPSVNQDQIVANFT